MDNHYRTTFGIRRIAEWRKNKRRRVVIWNFFSSLWGASSPADHDESIKELRGTLWLPCRRDGIHLPMESDKEFSDMRKYRSHWNVNSRCAHDNDKRKCQFWGEYSLFIKNACYIYCPQSVLRYFYFYYLLILSQITNDLYKVKKLLESSQILLDQYQLSIWLFFLSE